jgi:uncharacterized Ntn-hydrolase superfamily protein
MKKNVLLLISIFLLINRSLSQDTFSIVAADSATKYVGSAGASCVDLFQFALPIDFLGDLIPGLGAINTQASYDQVNQETARDRMKAGLTPRQIITFVNENDAAGDSTIRQYGIAGIKGNTAISAGYTGRACLDYKNNITGNIDGIYYSIQGNILLGQKVLDSMEAGFRRAQGDMACRLMAALQGAKMQGADTRCAGNGTSSLFAFVKVSKPTDAYGSPYFRVMVKTHDNAHIEPIDTLQKLFNLVNPCFPLGILNSNFSTKAIFPNPFMNSIYPGFSEPVMIKVIDGYGSIIFEDIVEPGKEISTAAWRSGTYFMSCSSLHFFITKKIIKK